MKLLCTLTILLLPLLGLAFESDPQVVEEVTNPIIERIVAEIPSTVVGEVAGVFAGTIPGFARSLFEDRQMESRSADSYPGQSRAFVAEDMVRTFPTRCKAA